MTIANVALSDTFDTWRIRTNQLIVQSEQTNTLVVNSYINSNAAFNASNNSTQTAANIAANVLISNVQYLGIISNTVNTYTNNYLSNTAYINVVFSNVVTNTVNVLVNNYIANVDLSLIQQKANDAFDYSNSALIISNAAFTVANAGYGTVNAAYTTANAGYGTSNAAYTTANAGYTTGNVAFIVANASFVRANVSLMPSVISANTIANASTIYIATANINLTLPTSPAVGDRVGFNNSGTNTYCTILTGSSNLMFMASQNLVVDIPNTTVILQFAGAVPGWIIL